MRRVFVSYSSDQGSLAEHVVRYLERRDIPCWIASRDIPPGSEFDVAIVEAIRNCSAMLLIFSGPADESSHVKREINLADDYKKLMLTLRVEDVYPDKLAYWIKINQWINWLDRRDETLEKVVNALSDHLAGRSGQGRPAETHFQPNSPPDAPERSVDSTLPGGRQMFAPQCTVESSVYLGPPGGGKLGKAIFSLMGSPRKVEKGGYSIRNFDWDGSVIVRPCDVHLGADQWDSYDGTHKFNVTYSEESWATMFAILFMDGILFGNGVTMLFRDRYGHVNLIDSDCEIGSFVISPDRARVAWLGKDSSTLHLLEKRNYDSYNQKTAALSACFKRGYYTRLYFNPHKKADDSLYCFEGSPTPDRPDSMAALARFDLASGQFAENCTLPALQTIAVSPDGRELIAITTEHIYRLNAHRLEIIEKIVIGRVRETDVYIWPPVQYSPCGRYIALSISKSGEIEVFDAQRFRRLGTLRTGGTPSTVFSWSCDGKYLAASVLPRSGSSAKLLVWDIDNWKLAAEISPLRHRGSDFLYSNRPGYFQWHENRNEFVVLLTTGDIIRYAPTR